MITPNEVLLVLLLASGGRADAGTFDSKMNCDRAGYEWTRRGLTEDAWFGTKEVTGWECIEKPEGYDEPNQGGADAE